MLASLPDAFDQSSRTPFLLRIKVFTNIMISISVEGMGEGMRETDQLHVSHRPVG